MIPALRSLFPALLLAAIPLLPLRLHADIKVPEGAGKGPAMTDIQVTAVRGVPKEIELKGLTGTNQAIKFEIVEQPKLGTLSPLEERWHDKALVKYTADPNREGDTDVFVYTGKLAGSSSIRATVRVTILKHAPRIDVHPQCDAGRIVLGAVVTKDFNLLNNGNALWSAKIPAPKHWRWKTPEGGKFEIPAGGRIKCELMCEGAATGVTDETIVFDGEVKVRFTSLVVPPFTVEMKDAVLRWKPSEKNRQATVALQNMGSAQVKVTVETPPWIKLPPVVELTPDLKAPLVFKAEGQVGETLTGVVKLTSGKYVQEVKVTALPGPGVLEMTSAANHGDAFNFGMLNAETIRTASHRVTVKNAGGAETTVTVDALKTFRFETPPPAEVKLAAGAEFSVTVLPPQDVAGWPSEELVFNAPGSRLELLLVAGLEAKDIPPTAGSEAIRELIRERKSGGGQLTKKEIERVAVTSGIGMVEATGREDLKIPRINEVDIVQDDGESITVAWKVPPGGDWTFQMQCPGRIYKLGPGRISRLWEPCGDDVKISVKDGVATAVIGNLVDGAPVLFRITTLSPDGRTSFPGKPISWTFRALQFKEPFNWKLWVVIAVGVAFAGFKLWKYWKKPISAR